MPRKTFSQRVRADIIFRERLPGEEAFDPVQWQMPTTLMRVFQAEARRRQTDLNSLIAEFVCGALTERAEATPLVPLLPHNDPFMTTRQQPPSP